MLSTRQQEQANQKRVSLPASSCPADMSRQDCRASQLHSTAHMRRHHPLPTEGAQEKSNLTAVLGHTVVTDIGTHAGDTCRDMQGHTLVIYVGIDSGTHAGTHAGDTQGHTLVTCRDTRW